MSSFLQASPSPTDPFITFEKSDIEQSIPARFEQQVARHPDKPAVQHPRQRFTYAELNRRANHLAWAIVEALGPAPEPVALLLDQGSELVAAVLGILKAGKFYVPLDPLAPPAQTGAVLAKLQTRLLITGPPFLSSAHQVAGPNQTVLSLDTIGPHLSADNPDLSLGPESLAYIFFTSGSTGRPKGVLDNHRNVLHNVMRYTNSLRISSEDRLSLIQTPTFSGTVSSLFGALLNGAVICPYNLRQAGTDGLAAWLNETGITIYHSVPTIFRRFLRDDVSFPSVRLIRLEGDRATRLDAALYRRYFSPSCLLVNGLGTTETGLCRQYFMTKERETTDSILPIGYPVVDMDVMLLDAALQEVGVHQNGQIAVKSRYLSLGYWRQPALTHASFLPDPQGGGARIYLTGDMGRLRPDGCLDYLGRIDNQVKIRGQKVVPAEIEQVLLGVAGIREAAVMTHEDRQGEARLVAYLVCSPEAEPSVVALRRVLRQHLPEASIPTAYVLLDSLPVTSQGKIDRQRLPEPTDAQPVRTHAYTAPQTDIERILAEIWQEVLEVERVGVFDNLIDLGGHSLLLAEVNTRLETHLGVRLTPAELLYQTLGQCAASCEERLSRH